MLYQFLKPIVSTAVRIFYKKVVIVNWERLNAGGATLLVSNHNNAFLDAIVVAMFAQPKIYSVARGDVFKKPFIAKLLGKLCIIPIFRREEGLDQMHKNYETFEKCMHLLEDKQSIIMYPEGNCVTEKRLRKLKKGAARIALGAEERNNFMLNSRILPIGLNYSAAKNFRSTLLIHVGEPILLKDYAQANQLDNVKAVNKLTQDIEDKIKELLIHIDDALNDEMYEEVLQVYKPVLSKLLQLNPANLPSDFTINTEVANAINYFHIAEPEQCAAFKLKIHDHCQQLKLLNIPVKLLAKDNLAKLTLTNAIKNRFLIGLGLPIHIIGFLLNYLPYRYAYKTADEKVKQVHFHASVNFVIGMFSWIFYYLFQLVLVGLAFKTFWASVVFALLIPATGLYSLWFYPTMKLNSANWTLLALSQNNAPKFDILLGNHQSILNDLEWFRVAYCKQKEKLKMG